MVVTELALLAAAAAVCALIGRALAVTRAELAAARAELDGERTRAADEARRSAADVARAVEPIAAHLRDVRDHIGRIERDRRASQGGLAELMRASHEELTRLRGETGALVGALKRPHVRGAWGEVQLRNVVRSAGMTERVDFDLQATVPGEDEGRTLRPDMVVHLPSGRDVVVDAKVPLDAYLGALEAQAELDRERLLDRHVLQLRAHVDRLAGKAYHERLERSAEFVVCFIPNEACYLAALDRDPALFEHGAARGVLLATPTTLLALLHATHYGWRQAEVERSAHEIARAGRELHRRSEVFLRGFARLGSQLAATTAAYNTAVGSLEGRMLPQIRRLDTLGAGSGRTLAEPAGVDIAVRRVTAAADEG